MYDKSFRKQETVLYFNVKIQTFKNQGWKFDEF